MKQIAYTVLLSCLGLSLLAQPSLAAEGAASSKEGWSYASSQIKWTGLGIKKEYRGAILPAESIYSGNPETAGNVIFTCYAGTYAVNFSPEPTDMLTVIRQGAVTGSVKLRRPNIKINGEKLRGTEWLYMPKFDLYRARKKSTSAKIYNAVIRGDVVEVKTRGRDYIPLNLPPVDTAFKKFGPECGLGVSAKKSG